MKALNMTPSRKDAFTIVELLVVIAVIATLVSILIPAVNSSREAARRSQCQSNMKNLGIATLTYESRNQKLPPASTYNVEGDWNSSNDSNRSGHSVFVYLLPFFEEAGVYQRVDRTVDWKANPSQSDLLKNSRGLVASVACPSAPEFRTAKAFGVVTHTDIYDRNVTDYVPVTRMDAVNSTNPPDYDGFVVDKLDSLVSKGLLRTDRRGMPAESTRANGQGNRKWNGMLQEFPNEKGGVPTALVRDGMSYTFLFFECGGRPTHYYGSKRNSSEQTITYYRWADKEMPVVINNSCYGKQIFNCHNNGEVFSFHRIGANFLMGDGAVAFLEEDIDPEVFTSLYTIDGGDQTDDSLF